MSYSQPLSEKTIAKMGLPSEAELKKRSEPVIKRQYMGNFFDNDSIEKTKIDLKTRLKFKKIRFKYFYYDLKQAIADYRRYWRIIADIRCWDGHHGMLALMIHHLEYYIET
ncbi:MAG: hypothetical protein LBB56_06265 [Chitinispirillales bacterium]|nr:hypothetical protein [Chitinispirillales bacterium]